VGPRVAQSLYDYFHDKDNIKTLDELRELGVNMIHKKTKAQSEGKLSGQTFLFTGTLKMKRSDAEAMVENEGGKIVTGVSAKLNYLVVGEDAGSKLEKAKKTGTVKILSEGEFLEMLR
jgi:DNA ligase (NAD+)